MYFLPKFHCELKFIKFFWGVVKKCLRDNCDYIFDTLKENMPKALASVNLATLRRWEHRMAVDGCLQDRLGDTGCTAAGPKIQLNNIQITQTGWGDGCVRFRPVIDTIWLTLPN